MLGVPRGAVGQTRIPARKQREMLRARQLRVYGKCKRRINVAEVLDAKFRDANKSLFVNASSDRIPYSTVADQNWSIINFTNNVFNGVGLLPCCKHVSVTTNPSSCKLLYLRRSLPICEENERIPKVCYGQTSYSDSQCNASCSAHTTSSARSKTCLPYRPVHAPSYVRG